MTVTSSVTSNTSPSAGYRDSVSDGCFLTLAWEITCKSYCMTRSPHPAVFMVAFVTRKGLSRKWYLVQAVHNMPCTCQHGSNNSPAKDSFSRWVLSKLRSRSSLIFDHTSIRLRPSCLCFRVIDTHFLKHMNLCKRCPVGQSRVMAISVVTRAGHLNPAVPLTRFSVISSSFE